MVKNNNNIPPVSPWTHVLPALIAGVAMALGNVSTVFLGKDNIVQDISRTVIESMATCGVVAP